MASASDKARQGFVRSFDLDEEPGGPPVLKLCNLILAEALAARATVISLVPTPEGCVVRWRVGDQWHDVMKIPSLAGVPLVNRLRVMANLDRTKGHQRQEGSFLARVQGNEVTFNVKTELRADGMEEALIECVPS